MQLTEDQRVGMQCGLFRLMHAALTWATTYATAEGSDTFRYPTVLGRHPFGLIIPQRTKDEAKRLMKTGQVKYVGWPVITDSHRWLLYLIADKIANGCRDSFQVTHLTRIVAHEVPEGRPDLEGDYIFFEIGFCGDTWIAGGCPDGFDQSTVDEPFALLGQVWGVQVQEVKIGSNDWNSNVLAAYLRDQRTNVVA